MEIKFIFICLLLATLTLGIVSASENITYDASVGEIEAANSSIEYVGYAYEDVEDSLDDGENWDIDVDEAIEVLPTKNQEINIGNCPDDVEGNFSLEIDGMKKDCIKKTNSINFDASDLTLGQHKYSLNFLGDDKYDPIAKNGVLNVSEIILEFPSEVSMGRDMSDIYVGIKCMDVAGALNFYFDGDEYDGYEAGESPDLTTMYFKKDASGEFYSTKFRMFFYADKPAINLTAIYKNGSKSIMKSTMVKMVNEDLRTVVKGGNLLIYGLPTYDTKPNATAEINGKSYEIQGYIDYDIDSPIHYVDISSLKSGNYTVKINYFGENLPFSAEANFSISKEIIFTDPEISLTAGDVYVGQNVKVEVSVLGATGIVVLTVNNKDYTLKLTDGMVSKVIYGLAEGKYDISVRYLGDDSFAAKTAQSTVSVLDKVSPKLAISISDIQKGEKAVINVSADSSIGGNVIVNVNGVDYTVKLSKGVGSKSVAGLAPGKYVVDAKYSGTSKFLAQNASGSFVVKDIPNVTVTAKNVYVGQNVAINVNADNATGIVVLTVNNMDYTLKLTDGMVSKVIYGLAEGKYDISVRYLGDDSFAAKTAQSTVSVLDKVSPNLSISVINAYVGKKVSVKVTADKGATGTVKVKVGNSTKNIRLSKGAGSVTFSGFKYNKKYAFTAEYRGDVKFKSDNVSKTVKVVYAPVLKAKNVAASYPAKSKFTVTVKGTNGNWAKSKYVYIYVNGKYAKKVKTNNKGVATYSALKAPGKYKITAKYSGKSVTKTLAVKHAVTLKKVTPKKSAKKLVLTATLKHGKNPIKNKKVTFNFNGKAYNVKTNKKGIAKLTIKKVELKKLTVGKTVKYQATYLKDTVKKSAKVKK